MASSMNRRYHPGVFVDLSPERDVVKADSRGMVFRGGMVLVGPDITFAMVDGGSVAVKYSYDPTALTVNHTFVQEGALVTWSGKDAADVIGPEIIFKDGSRVVVLDGTAVIVMLGRGMLGVEFTTPPAG